MSPTAVAYANIFVTDLSRAVSFFQDVLGLPLRHSALEHGYAAFSAGPITLGFAVAGEDQADLVGRHTGIGFATHDLEAEHRRLAEAGVSFPEPPTRQAWGGFMALFADPDGNVFYLDEVSATDPSDP